MACSHGERPTPARLSASWDQCILRHTPCILHGVSVGGLRTAHAEDASILVQAGETAEGALQRCLTRDGCMRFPKASPTGRLITGHFTPRSGPEEPGTPLDAPGAVDTRLRAVFEADRCYARRRAQRRRLQIALATSAILPIAAIWNQNPIPPMMVSVVLVAWAALFVLTHMAILSEWIWHQRLVQRADEALGPDSASTDAGPRRDGRLRR